MCAQLDGHGFQTEEIMYKVSSLLASTTFEVQIHVITIQHGYFEVSLLLAECKTLWEHASTDTDTLTHAALHTLFLKSYSQSECT